MPIVNTNTSNNTFTINGLTNGAEYRFRVAARNSNGIGPYTPYVNAIPVANAVDQYFYQVSLLLHMDGDDNSTTFTDVSLSPKSVSPNGGVKISTAQSKFGGASAYFDGNGDYLQLPNTASALEQNFTVEAWVRLDAMPTSDTWPTNWSNHMVVVGQGSVNAGDGWALLIGQNNLIFHSNDSTLFSAPHGMVIGQWYHVCACRSNGTLRLFVDGSQITEGAFAGNVGSGSHCWIGAETGQGAYLNGYIDELRITNSVARYTSNFAPSVIPFSQIPPPPTAPDAPTNLLAGSDADKIYLSWTQPEFDGNSSITDYQILFNRVSISGENVPDTISTIDTNNTNTVAEVAVTPDLKYEFSVKARNSVGLGPASSGVEIVASGQYDLLYNKTRLLLHMNDNNDIRDLYLLAEDPYWSDVVLLMDMDGK